MKYCGYCGKALQDNEKCTCADTTRKKKKTVFFAVIGVAATLPILLVGLVVAIIIGTAKVNPSAYLSEPVFSGNNTMGYASVDFDEKGLIESIIGEEPIEIFTEEAWEWAELYEDYSKNIVCEYPTSNLSNGDTFTVKIITTGIAAEKIKSIEKTYTVEGLAEIETIDVFEHVTVTFSGVSGNSTVQLEVNTEDEILNAYSFKIDPQYDVSNGDTVTVSITNMERVFARYNVVPTETEKTFTVEGLQTYATIDNLPLETILNIAEQFAAEEDSTEGNTDFLSCSKAEVYGCFFLKDKDSERNELHILVYEHQYHYGEYLRTTYVPLVFKNLLTDTNGNVEIKYEDGKHSLYFYTDVDEYMSDFEDEYTITKLD